MAIVDKDIMVLERSNDGSKSDWWGHCPCISSPTFFLSLSLSEAVNVVNIVRGALMQSGVDGCRNAGNRLTD